MEIRAAEISKVIKDQIANFGTEAQVSEVGSVLSVGERSLFLSYPGPNHEVGNIIIYVPHAKVLMMVDVVWPGWVPFHSIGVADHIPGIFTAMD